MKKLFLSLMLLGAPAWAITGSSVQPIVTPGAILIGTSYKTIGSTPTITYSSATDTVALTNIRINGTCTGNGCATGGVGGAFASWYLTDPNNVHWKVIVDTTGHYETSVVTSVPTGALAPHVLATTDPNANIWTIGIDIYGHIVTTESGTASQVVSVLLLSDPSGVTWVNTINTSGHPVTE